MNYTSEVALNKTVRILFIEDSEDDVELTVSELERAGYQIDSTRVETAQCMQAQLDQHPWDVIISDYKMPQFSAEKSLALYNSNALDIPFIIISGVVEADDAVYLLRQGAHDFLNKNSLARLIPAIERELRECEVRQNQRQVAQKVRTLSLAVEQSPVSVVITDPNGTIEYVNPTFETITGYSADEAIGRQFGFSFVSNEHDTDTHSLWQHIKQQGQLSAEVSNIHKDGMLCWESIVISPLEDENGNVIRFVSVQEDITARRSYETQLRNQAYYDPLTQLPNRALMMEKLHEAIDGSHQHCNATALFSMDLDNFKNINDSVGHTIGDELLIQTAERLATCTDNNDTLARIGSDEFVIVLSGADDNQLINTIAERIMQAFAAPFVIDDQQHFLSISIGVAKYPENCDAPDVLLKHASFAMYQAKSLGKNQCQFFSEELNHQQKHRITIQNALRGVEKRDELELFYQPIINGIDNSIVACEALLRWRIHDGHYCMPDTFIPIAEESGLINKLGQWVVARACKDLCSLRQQSNPALKMAINVSPCQLQARGFAEFVAEQLDVNQLPTNSITLEITESVIIHDVGETNTNLKALCDMGISLSIDDFGTGYSSLAYLQKYPFIALKIDRSFINQIENNTDNTKLTETMITMAHNLGLQVVAEGVETIEQHHFLQKSQCELMQGYLFSRPIPLEQLTELLSTPYSVQ